MAQPMTTTHPSRGDLAAFVAGRADDAQIRGIETHLAGCEACRAALKTIPPDALETLVRAAVVASGERPEDEGTDDGRPSCDVPADLQRHPRYRVLGVIGAGGMGTVYRAEHRLMRRQVAVKVISPKLLTRPDAVTRFRREVEAVSQLSHPNIATAFDAERVGDSLVLVTELIDGHDLAQVVTRRGALPVIEACEYVRQAANGLQHAHDRGIVHRDIKPSNLMLTPGGVVKILDFGLAALGEPDGAGTAETVAGLNGSLTDFGQAFGTPGFVAPEQRRDAHAVDARADIFSLGCTLRFLLTGDANADLGKNKNLPAALVTVVGRMTKADAERRFQSAAEVMAAMSPFLHDRTTRRRWLVAVGLAGAAGVGLLLWSRREVPRDGDTEMPPSYLQFSRPTDTVAFPGRVELDATCTIEARVMLTTDDAKDWCVFNQWQSGKEDLYLGVSPGGISGCCHPVANVDARCLVALNEWHHVAFVCDEKQARLYLDGRLVGAAAAKGKIGKGDGVPTIGAVWRPPEEPRGSFIGNLHWLRVSNVARYSGASLEPPGEPAPDANTLLLYPGETASTARPATGFPNATAPKSSPKTK